ncbi:MAG: PAS domain S-box protein [Chloroflexi bacterium]|nr:PAS domain S-box protein [Chloroflexota bacterium]
MLPQELLQAVHSYCRDEAASEALAQILDVELRACAERETTLRQNEARLRGLVDCVVEGISLTDEQGRIIEWNPGMEAITGLRREAVLGQSIIDVQLSLAPPEYQTPEQIARITDAINTYLRTGQAPWHNQLREQALLRPDGTLRWIQQRSFRIPTEKGFMMGGVVHDVTEERSAREALQNSEARLRTLFEATALGIAITDINGDHIEVNPAMQRMLGYSAEELWQMNISQITHPDDWVMQQPAADAVIEGRQNAYSIEKRYLRKDGTSFWARVNGAAIRDAQGQPIGGVAVIEDTTERRRADEALRASERLYREIFEQNRAVKLLIDPQTGKIVDANPAAVEFYKTTPEILKTMRITDINMLPPEIVFEKMTAAVTGEQRIFQFRHRLADGDIRDVEVFSSPVHLQGRDLLHSIVIDVTERNRAEESLRRSEASVRAIFDSTPQALVFIDTSHQIVTFNNLFQEQTRLLFGFDVQPGDSIYRIVCDENRESFERRFAQALQGATVIVEKTPVIENTERVFEIRYVPVTPEPGQVIGVCLMAEDITERKKDQARLIELTLEREHGRILADFVHLASHEFRTPLSIIGTSVYLLEKKLDSGFAREHLAAISAQADSILKLVEALLIFSQLQSGMPFRFEMISLNDVARAVNSRLLREIEVAQQTVRFELDAALPPVLGDLDMLDQAYHRLLDNAHRFTPPGGTITVRTFRLEDDCAALEVRDTGMGIRPESLPHIFDLYFRDDTAHSTPGFGLGLPIARRIIEQHNGLIEVETALGAGCVFRIVLPPAPATKTR